MKRIFLLLFLLLSINTLAAVGNLDNIRISNLHTKNSAGEINKLAPGTGKWSINFDIEIVGHVQGGDTYTINSFGPKIFSYNDSSIKNPASFFNSGVSIDVQTVYDIKIGNEIVGSLQGRVITFNDNITKYQNAKVTISIGIGSVHSINMLKTDPLYGTYLKETFYLFINNAEISNTKVDIKASSRSIKTPQMNNYSIMRIVNQPINGKTELVLFANPYAVLKDIRDSGNWQTDIIKIRANLPKGMALKYSSKNFQTGIRYLNDGDRFNDNRNIYNHYLKDGRQFSLTNYKISENVIEGTLKSLKHPFDINQGGYDATLLGVLEVNDLSIINWETGEILNGEIELIYYLNDAYHSNLKINKVQIIIPSNVLEAEGLLPKKEFNITAEVVNGIINNEGTVTYNKDETVTYHFKPKEGYKIKSILIDGVEQEVLGDSYAFEKLDKDYTIKVIYEKIEETNIPVTGLRKASAILIVTLTLVSFIAYKITKRKYI